MTFSLRPASDERSKIRTRSQIAGTVYLQQQKFSDECGSWLVTVHGSGGYKVNMDYGIGQQTSSSSSSGEMSGISSSMIGLG